MIIIVLVSEWNHLQVIFTLSTLLKDIETGILVFHTHLVLLIRTYSLHRNYCVSSEANLYQRKRLCLSFLISILLTWSDYFSHFPYLLSDWKNLVLGFCETTRRNMKKIIIFHILCKNIHQLYFRCFVILILYSFLVAKLLCNYLCPSVRFRGKRYFLGP